MSLAVFDRVPRFGPGLLWLLGLGLLSLAGSTSAAGLAGGAGPGVKALFPQFGGSFVSGQVKDLALSPPQWSTAVQGKVPGHWRRSDGERDKRLVASLYLSSALALSAGVFAYWSKDEADTAYDNYRKAAGQQRQDKQIDRAKRYDRISAVGFVLMEVGVVWTTYLVFF
ncbi:MAG: hypothetical protein GKR89_27075 [Candidatus Latescibacteria bacterium]|nr:hypothetical protein [Candidatus Latescibacterota bacterium]